MVEKVALALILLAAAIFFARTLVRKAGGAGSCCSSCRGCALEKDCSGPRRDERDVEESSEPL